MTERDYRIAAVDRALTVLQALGQSPDQTLTQLADQLELNKSQVFRLLQTLEARGFVARDETQSTYALGLQMSILGARADGQKGLIRLAAPVMDTLAEATAENVNLLVRQGTQALVVATREGRHSMRLFAQAGRYGPLHAGGASMVLLAHAPATILAKILAGGLPAFTPATLTDPATLRRKLARIRNEGVNVSRNDFEEGAFSIAAPIYDNADQVVAAISVAGAAARLDQARTRTHTSAVRRAAAEISHLVGQNRPQVAA